MSLCWAFSKISCHGRSVQDMQLPSNELQLSIDFALGGGWHDAQVQPTVCVLHARRWRRLATPGQDAEPAGNS